MAELSTTQIKRGLAADRPTSGMLPGEQFFAMDRGVLDVAIDATTRKGVVPEIDALAAIPSINGAADLLIMHDADATGVKEKKVLFNDFKTALNIPASSTDEKVAVAAGGTAGYLWGTTGNDGLLRVNNSLVVEKDAGNGYITLRVGAIDCGTF